MEHFILFYYILSFSSGVASTYLALLLYFQYRKKAILNFFLFLLSLSIIMLSFLLHEYENIVHIGIDMYANFIDLAGGWLLLCIMPFFSHYIVGVRITPVKKRIFIASGIVLSISIILLIIFLFIDIRVSEAIEAFILDPALIFYIGYCIFRNVSEYNSIADKTLKKGLNLFYITTLIYLPMHIAAEYSSRLNIISLPALLEILSFPTYFLIINIMSMLFSIKLHNRPAFIREKKLSGYFIEKYSITERETDIIHYLIDGLNNTEISKKLFVSIKTIENHLTSIYTKTDVKNRVQLVNLILTNQ